MTSTAVILVGGVGKRLGTLTKKTPKPLIQINGNYFLNFLIYNICKFNFKKIFLICGYKKNFFYKNFHKRLIFGVKIICVFEKRRKDTGGALFEIKKYINNDFILFNGDSLFNINIKNFINFSKKNNFLVNIALTKNENYKSNSKLSSLKIKNSKLEISNKTGLMNGGIYFIKKEFLKLLKKEKKSLERDILTNMIYKKKVGGKLYKDYFIDIGTKSNLIKAKKELKNIIKFKTAFLDRDGVINEDYGYVFQKKNFILKKGVIEAIRFLNKKRFLVIIITNQSGIGRGFYGHKDLAEINKYFFNKLMKNNSSIDDLFYCPHHPVFGMHKYKIRCYCRKPMPGMILKAKKKWSLDISKSFFIGDKHSDKKSADNAKVKFYYKNKNSLLNQIKEIIN